MNKSIIFDTGPIISLSLNNLLWLLEPLQEQFGGPFYISEGVRKELIERPLHIKRFQFEALQTLKFIEKGVLTLCSSKDCAPLTEKLSHLANHMYRAGDKHLHLVQQGEMSALALALHKKSHACVVDERTTRMMVEAPFKLHKTLERKMRTHITINKANVRAFQDLTKSLSILRSIELVTVAYKMGLLDKYLPSSTYVKHPRKMLLKSALWAIKLKGSSVSSKEIDQIVQSEL